jgi:hypothetical protein
MTLFFGRLKPGCVSVLKSSMENIIFTLQEVGADVREYADAFLDVVVFRV